MIIQPFRAQTFLLDYLPILFIFTLGKAIDNFIKTFLSFLLDHHILLKIADHMERPQMFQRHLILHQKLTNFRISLFYLLMTLLSLVVRLMDSLTKQTFLHLLYNSSNISIISLFQIYVR